MELRITCYCPAVSIYLKALVIVLYGVMTISPIYSLDFNHWTESSSELSDNSNSEVNSADCRFALGLFISETSPSEQMLGLASPVPPDQNLALTGTASSNSVWGGFAFASRAIDNNTNGAWNGGSVAHTAATTANDWIDIELSESADISEIIIWNRTDCCSNRLSNCYVLVSSTPFPANTDMTEALNNATFTHQIGSISNEASVTVNVNSCGSYVRLQKSGSNPGGNALNVSEIQVMGCIIPGDADDNCVPDAVECAQGGTENLSQNATTDASSVYQGTAVSSRLIDGDTNGTWSNGSVASTAGSTANDWMDVILPGLSSISEIVISNRTDCCANRLSNCYVLVSSNPFPANTNLTESQNNAHFSYQIGEITNESSVTVNVNACGRYVRIQKSGSNTGGNHMNLAEIQVMGCPNAVDSDGDGICNSLDVDDDNDGILDDDECSNGTVENLSLSGSASSNSVYGGYAFASRTIDGNTNGVWSGGSVAHTAATTANDWMEISLSGISSISEIVLWNRTDCCSNRLSNCYVLISENPFPSNTDLSEALANASFTYQLGGTNGQTSISIPVDSEVGRYVRIQKSGVNTGGNALNIAEIQVMGSALCDDDNDGIVNHLDLDGDGDGCNDVIEAGLSDPDGDGLLGSSPVTVDATGRVTSAAGYTGIGTAYNPTILVNECDTDGDGIAPLVDLDDDNDGVPDIIELGTCLGEIDYEYYDVVPSGYTVDNIPTTNPDGHGTTDEINVDNIYSIHPGNDTRFSIRYRGRIYIDEAKDYTFYTGSDDGSKLLINGTTVVSNDGLHGYVERSGTIFLPVGFHEFELLYFENYGGEVLTWDYEATGITTQRIPFDILFPVTCLNLDIDGDGITNDLDLDSDGDGCSDGVEAGNTAMADNDVSTINSGTDANNNGLLDQFEDGSTGNINYTSTYLDFGVDSAISACLDTDGDGVSDPLDIDDDNDGILDEDESCTMHAEDFSWHGTAAGNVSSPNPGTLAVSGSAWANAYSNELINIPFVIEGTVTAAVNGMIGVIGASAPETSGWNDGGYKFQFNAANGMYVRHGSTVSGWHGPSIIGTTFRLEVDDSGNMNYWHDGSNVYTGTVSGSEFKLTISRGSFSVDNFSISQSPQECIDFDLDGIPNVLDLDSDGDGCSDSVEAGNTNLSDNDITNYNTGADANGNGLLDAFESGNTGQLNYTSTYDEFGLDGSLTACLDTDGDGVADVIDIDDDNDGVLDDTEGCSLRPESLSWHGTAAGNVSSPAPGVLSVSGSAWANTYSDQLVNIPLTIEGTVTSAVNGMIGILGVNLSETSGWNDGGYKFQFNGGNGMYVRHGAATSGWHGPSIVGTSFRLEIDELGNMQYIHNGSVVYTGTVPDIDYKLTVSRGSFTVTNFSVTETTSNCEDVDGDGIVNRLDLDADGDGCSDSVEAGNTALGDNDTSSYNSGTDANGDGLLDIFEDPASGGINYSSTYSQFAHDDQLSGCLDTDNDNVADVIDIDDDNDGVLDVDENCLLTPEDLTWHGTAAANVTNPSEGVLSVSGGTWYNAYSDQQLNIPLTIEGIISNATNGMIGILPDDATETSGWNDGGYKFQFNGGNGMYVRHGASTSGWHGPSLVGKKFKLEVDASGSMSYWNDGTLVYTGTVPDVDYKLTISTGSFSSREFRVVHNDVGCSDEDNDGTPNHLDLDSDGDDCSDSVEAGNTAVTSNNTSDYNTGADVNANGLLDQFEESFSGEINYTSTYVEYAMDASVSACLDTDEDGVVDIFDLDDDNDGVLDLDEHCTSTPEQLTWHGSAAGNMTNPEQGTLTVTGNAWRNAYSDQTFSIPLSIEGVVTSAVNGMIGILDATGTETTDWNDGAYKFQFNSGNGMYVRHGSATSGWHGPSIIGTKFRLEVDDSGTMTYSHNGAVVYTGSIPDVEYKLSVSRGSFAVTDFIVKEESSACTDADGDGVINQLDLDSDGDDCFDAVEAGAEIDDIDADGAYTGGVDSNGVPLLASGGLSVTPELLDPSAQSDNCCDVSDGTIDCDLDGFTNAEELAGVCGYVGNPNDYNSPFKHQETIGSGTTDDMIYQLELVNVIGYLEEGKDVHLTIKSGHSLVLNSDISVRNLTVETGASLDLNGYRLQISGDLRLDGDFTHSMGHLYMSDDCEARHIYGSGTKQLHELTIENQHGVTLHTGLEVSGPIHPESGVFDLNSQDVVLTSYPIDGTVRTGSISEIKTGADVIGDITIQRYVESLEDGYRFLGPPIKNLQVSDISDDFVTTGFPGSDYPNHYFTNLKFYDEDDRPTNALESGYKDVTSTTDALAEYQGYWAYFPPSTSVNVLDATGEFYKGDVVYDLSYTFTDSPHCDGWHCIINPYPSAIDLTSSCIEFTNVSGAIYILDHEMGGTWQGEYVVYNNGISVNGGTGVVASFQAFMVQATGPNASITFRECAKTDEQGVFYRSSEEEKSFIRLALDKNDEAYETVIAFDESATTSYDPEFDGRRWKAEMYSLATVMEEDTLSINTLPEIGEDLSVPILVTAPDTGVYQLKISEVSNLDPLYCMFIEDTQTGELMPVVSGGELEFEVTEEAYYEERFILHAHRIVDMETNPPYCSDENSGSAEVSLSGGGDGFFKWYDFTDALILEEEGSSSELSGVPSGTYYVQVSGSNMLCGTSWVEVEIGVGEGEIVEINSTPDYCSGGFANLKVKVLGAESWTVHLYKDYEEITSGSSSDLVEFTDLEGAIYDVVVETACSRNEYVLDLSDPDAVKADFEAPGELLIENIGVELEVEALSENADRHQWFLDEYFQGDDDIISLTFDEVGSYTLKLNSSNEYCSDAYQQEIMVSAASVIQENLEKDFLTINREAQFEIVRLNDLTGKIQVKLYDAKGSTIYEQMDTGKTKITIDKSNLSPGVYILEIKTEAGKILSKKYSK